MRFSFQSCLKKALLSSAIFFSAQTLIAQHSDLLDSAANTGGPTLSQLVKSMDGYPSTQEWDVVASYSVSKLNEFLKNHYDNGKLVRNLTIKLPSYEEVYTNTTSSEGTVLIAVKDTNETINLLLEAPYLYFNIDSDSPRAFLKIPIKKSSYMSYVFEEINQSPDINHDQLTIIRVLNTQYLNDTTYTLQFSADLATMKMSTGKVINTKDLVSFEDGSQDSYGITFDFNSVNYNDTFIEPPIAWNLTDSLVTVLVDELNKKQIDYVLGGINNKQSSNPYSLTPKSFIMSTYGSGTDSVLSLFIQTAESGNHQGTSNPKEFTPGGLSSTLPLPQGYSASLILSYELITDYYLKNQIAPNGSGITMNFTTSTQPGIQAYITSNQSLFLPEERHSVQAVIIGQKTPVILHYLINPISFYMNNINPLSLTINNQKAQLSWSDSKKVEWDRVPSRTSSTVLESGHFNVIASLNKTVPFQPITNQSINVLDYQSNISDFSITNDRKECKGIDKIFGVCTYSPPENMVLSNPSNINLDLTSLNFFATTNLFFPQGQLINFNSTVGVKTPKDFLMVGDIVSPAQAATAEEL